MQIRNTRFTLPLALSALTLLGGSLALINADAQKKAQKQPAPQCKITPVQAINIALGKVPGRPLNANFEFAEGKWVYGVMVVNGKTIKEVEIDPMTGKVGDTETITPEDEAKEIQQELNAAIGNKTAAPEKEGKEGDEKPEKP